MNEMLFDQDHRGMSPEPGSPRRRRPLLVGLAVVAAVVVLGLIGAGLWVKGKIDPGGAPGEEIALTIPEGATTSDIAELLADEGVISDAGIFGYYVQFTGGATFQAGDYTLARNSSMGDVVATLDEGPEIAFDQVTVPDSASSRNRSAEKRSTSPTRSATSSRRL